MYYPNWRITYITIKIQGWNVKEPESEKETAENNDSDSEADTSVKKLRLF